MTKPCRNRAWLNVLCGAAGVVALAGPGCTYTSSGMDPGTLKVQPPLTMPSAAPAAPPDSSSPTVGAPELPPSGTYAGTGLIRGNPGGGCDRQVTIRNFVVTGDQVRYFGFRGTIRPDLSLRMQSGRRRITGTFHEDRFAGLFWQPQPACTYNLALTHVG